MNEIYFVGKTISSTGESVVNTYPYTNKAMVGKNLEVGEYPPDVDKTNINSTWMDNMPSEVQVTMPVIREASFQQVRKGSSDREETLFSSSSLMDLLEFIVKAIDQGELTGSASALRNAAKLFDILVGDKTSDNVPEFVEVVGLPGAKLSSSAINKGDILIRRAYGEGADRNSGCA